MELANESPAATVPDEQHFSTQERAKRLRARAEELRAMSEGMGLTAARTSMGHIAAAFEKLAAQVERQLRQSIKQPD
jgi:HAMP domain-containing protein